MSFTKVRPGIPPGDLAGVVRWINNYINSLEIKGALSIDEAVIRAANGIKFPATQNAQTDVNTLDDYEEGNWTPADASGAGLSLTVDHAFYTKIGRLVTGQAKVTYPVTANASGATISGLPFPSAKQCACAMFANGSNVASGFISGSTVSPEPPGGGGRTNAQMSGLPVWMSFSYIT